MESVPFDDELAASLAREMDQLSDEERAEVVSYLSEDRSEIILNPAAYSAFNHVVGDVEGLQDIEEPLTNDLASLPPLFSSRFKVS